MVCVVVSCDVLSCSCVLSCPELLMWTLTPVLLAQVPSLYAWRPPRRQSAQIHATRTADFEPALLKASTVRHCRPCCTALRSPTCTPSPSEYSPYGSSSRVCAPPPVLCGKPSFQHRPSHFSHFHAQPMPLSAHYTRNLQPMESAHRAQQQMKPPAAQPERQQRSHTETTCFQVARYVMPAVCLEV